MKFVDFCGKYRLPLLQYLCSPTCTTSSLADNNGNNNSIGNGINIINGADTYLNNNNGVNGGEGVHGIGANVEDGIVDAQDRLRRVLLG